ncbi:hypothetical protein GALL_421410 [mine drainage metagenome]|uniref:Uncharacterized protein n=1 Tax=mine drainage metagenome TaxID=410659 RepID=A0A1J5PYN4_9ZZZZ
MTPRWRAGASTRTTAAGADAARSARAQRGQHRSGAPLQRQQAAPAQPEATEPAQAAARPQQRQQQGADPDRAAGLIAKFKSLPGVVAAGWTTGLVEMERTIRFPAADWRDGDRLNKDKLAATISNVLAGTLSAKSSSTAWSTSTGKLRLTFKRPSELFPTLDLTETIEVTALVAPEKPGASDRLMLWISNPAVSTADEAAGPKLDLANDSNGDEEGDQKDDNGSVDALAREFKGQRWDADKSVWK